VILQGKVEYGNELTKRTARQRRWSTEQKLRIIGERFEPGETVSTAACGAEPALSLVASDERGGSRR
jgi:hypothetical protein